MPGANPLTADPAEAEWGAYFDSLVVAARELVQGAADRTVLAFPVLSPPALPLPDSLDGRRDDVTRLLTSTTRELERRQADVARELAELRPRPARSPYRNDVGNALDLLG